MGNNLQLIGLQNNGSQTLLTGETINAGTTYRQYSKKSCGTKTFLPSNNGLTIQQEGIYHITATLVGTGTIAGEVTVQLFQDGVAIPSAISTETITTPTTEFRTFTIDYYILVNNKNILNCETSASSSITLQNTGVGATFTNVVLNVTKEV